MSSVSFCSKPVALCRYPSYSGRFEDPWADEETVLGHPEKEVLSYLETCASTLGLALDLEAKVRALETLRSVTLAEGGGIIAASTAKTTTGSASSYALGELDGDSGNDVGVRKDGGIDRGESVSNNTATVSSAQDVYATVTTALSRALVHCKRFEVCCGDQKGDHEIGARDVLVVPIRPDEGLHSVRLRSIFFHVGRYAFRLKNPSSGVCLEKISKVGPHGRGGEAGGFESP